MVLVVGPPLFPAQKSYIVSGTSREEKQNPVKLYEINIRHMSYTHRFAQHMIIFPGSTTIDDHYPEETSEDAPNNIRSTRASYLPLASAVRYDIPV